MPANDEALANAKAIATRLAVAAGDEPMNDLMAAVTLLVAYSLKKETANLAESRRELEKFRAAIDATVTELWGH